MKMKRGRHSHKRSKNASVSEGFPQIRKLRTDSRLFSDPHSYINASIRNETLVEVRQSSIGRATDRPLVNLQAKRILKESEPKRIHKETEPKRRSLSGIARLLRREGLPSLWHAYKQKKKLLYSYKLNNNSINVEPNRQLYDGQSDRRSPKKEQEFKDVHEDPETSTYVSGRYSSRWNASSMLTKSDMALIRKNLASKRLTHDETASEKLQESEGLYNTSGTIESRDISVQSGRKQKPLWPNPVYDLQGTSSSSLGCPTMLLNPPSSAKYNNTKSRILNRNIAGEHKTTYHANSGHGLPLNPNDYRRAHTAHRTSDFHLGRTQKNILPTPIVVLRPNQEDMQNAHRSPPHHSQGYSSNSRKVEGHPSVECSTELSWRKTESYYDAEFVKPGYEEARKLAYKITRRLRDACAENEVTLNTGFRGHLVDGDLYNAEESDFNSDLEMLKWSSRCSFGDDNKQGSHLSSGSFNAEAKRRLAERWKTTHKFRDLEIIGKDKTLGEMLSTHDGAKRSSKIAHGRADRSNTQVGTDNGTSSRNGFEGTISKGDSQHRTERTSRSRSIPPIGGRTHEISTCHDMLVNEKYMLHSEAISRGSSKVTKQHPSHKDHFSSQGSQVWGKKPLRCPPINIEEIDSSLENRFEIQMEANVKDLPYRKLSFQRAEKDNGSGSDAYEILEAEQGITALLSTTSLLSRNNSSVENESSSSTAHDPNDFCLQELNQGPSEERAPSLRYLGAEPISPESDRGADYASPVSVLEIPFVDVASSSPECFERVNAELNDLRMQLQLLKLEGSAFDDKSNLMHSSLRAETWEASYALDVLIYAGLHDLGFDLFCIIWHSPDCPLDPRLFYVLEEKYCNEIAGTRPERLLLFNRINSALLEIYHKHVELLPWAMPKLAGSIHLTWQKRRARDVVEKLIRQESANVMQAAERMLDRDMQWSGFTDEIASTGYEIEKLLLDDLLNELLFLVMVID